MGNVEASVSNKYIILDMLISGITFESEVGQACGENIKNCGNSGR